jgi:catechol 2,3-dioxygenase
MSEFQLPRETHIGAVQLAVTDLVRARRFYEGLLGLSALPAQENSIALAAGGPPALLLLTGQPGTRRRPPRTTGLYHIAIHLPHRADLGRALLHLSQARYPLQGAADHLVSESLYLTDPDGNGLELYVDRPREQWDRQNGQVRMGTEPLDVDSLVLAAEQAGRPWEGMPRETRIGHVHLQVHDLEQTEAFYRRLLGLNLTLRFGSGALFFAAGGYHHHVGANTWASRNAPPPPPDTAGLRHFTLVVPTRTGWERLTARLEANDVPVAERPDGLFLQDPAGNGVLLAMSEP